MGIKRRVVLPLGVGEFGVDVCRERFDVEKRGRCQSRDEG